MKRVKYRITYMVNNTYQTTTLDIIEKPNDSAEEKYEKFMSMLEYVVQYFRSDIIIINSLKFESDHVESTQ